MNSRLSFLFNHSNDMFCVFDKKGEILYVNRAFEICTGYEAEFLKGRIITELFHRADIDRNLKVINELPQLKESSGYETRLKAKNGRFLNVTWSAIYSDEDHLMYASGKITNGKLHARDPYHIIDKIQHIIESLTEGFLVLDKNWQITAFNPAFQAMVGLSAPEIKDAYFTELPNLNVNEEVLSELDKVFANQQYTQVQYFAEHLKRWFRLNLYPYQNEAFVFIRDITLIKDQQMILALEKRVLELNAMLENTLAATTSELLKGIEAIYPEMVCSILELDPSNNKVYHLAGPSLDEEYIRLINGSEIGPENGSCGTAAFYKKQVIVADIENDPLWENYKSFSKPFNLKACWSTPVMSSEGDEVLATFAIYYKTTREPKPEELQIIDRTTNIIRVLIESKRNHEHVRQQNNRLRDIASLSSHELRRPVATILGLANLFDEENPGNPVNKEVIDHMGTTAKELDKVIHLIVDKTFFEDGK